MGYRDLFYVKENIIGYTGTVTVNPTVYFQSGQEFGHITQDHDVKENIGREEVDTDPDYTIGNEDTPDGRRSVERKSGEEFHTSRSLFVSSADMPDVQISILAQAITRFPEMKTIGTLSQQEWEAVVYGENIGTRKTAGLVKFHKRAIAKGKAGV